MPVLFIEAPPGIRPEAKRKMVQKLTEAIDEAYHIGDTLIFLREYSTENVAMDGRLQSENPKIQEALKKISAGAWLGFFRNSRRPALADGDLVRA
jgi:phenylpyruvate tautomerase PptA (4-oxalocrotonate tautomerase family)